MRAIRHSPDQGSFDVVASPFDGAERIYVYRKVPRHGVYVVTGVDKAAITRMWLDDMSRHLIFGIPGDAGDVRARRRGAAPDAARGGRASSSCARRRRAARSPNRRCARRRRWKRSAASPAASRTTSTTCSPPSSATSISRCAASKGETEADERIVRSLNAARRASERAASLVGRLLAFSRQHPLEVKSVDINRLVQGMSELLRQTLGETVKVETVLAGGMWKTAVDPNQLENAILNLAVNSRDAMPNGGRLTIETANAVARRRLRGGGGRRLRARPVRHGRRQRHRHRHEQGA